MGQKINPLGFRLGITQIHYSFWFAKPKYFSMGLQEDERIRRCIHNYVQNKKKISSGFEGIAYMRIQKKIDLIQVMIYIGFPNLLREGLLSTWIGEELQRNVQKKFHRIFNIVIIKIEKPYAQPNILAEYIALQFKNRVSVRKIMKKVIELTEQTDTKGIQVQIAGRIDGKEIARVEWIREGRVPLQTICAKIDYCSYTIRTIYGNLGIKIWIFANK
uniref:Small ribosomal subunit protein uS3c n=1 Tax=Rhizanthella gardneri TaxID=112168 RepID=E7BKV9_RHIGD|nr:ribosomal protein S3 [Rhizanthella gardneri]ACU46591.1 ribosomal protein S3 [Rhizanthella gardneri]